MDTPHRDYVNTTINMPPYSFGARPSKNLIREICQKHNFDVWFMALGASKPAGMNGFVSWLTVHFEEKAFEVVYDATYVRGADTVFEQDKKLAKALLHECGHAALHLQIFKDRIKAGDPSPSLDAQHEQEAWCYALTVWGMLTGDHALYTRRYGNSEGVLTDEGFCLA